MEHETYKTFRKNEYEEEQFILKSKKKKWNYASCGLGVALGAVIGLALFFGLYFGLPAREVIIDVTTVSPTSTPAPPPSYQSFKTAAVATDAGPCSVIGKDILQRGGSVVDSAIASMLCVGLYNCHSSGIGGGFFMTVYDATTGNATFINSREVAPRNAEENMFKGNSELSVIGGMAVAVPGEVAGYWAAHQRYGKLPWKELFAPAIKIAQEGLVVTSALAGGISGEADYIHNRTFNLWPLFENDDGSPKVEGDIVRRPQLAKTLQILAEEGASAFYNGSLTDDILRDLEDAYGDSIITKEDLLEYKTEVKQALHVFVDNLEIFTPGPPASGSVMALILNILDGYDFNADSLKDEDSKILTYHRIVEAFRYAYAKRSSLGDERNNPNVTKVVNNMTAEWYADAIRLQIDDSRTFPVEHYGPDFVLPDDHGTAHLSIMGPNGDAVAMTSTINTIFGSKIRGRRTGIIFNNEMDDFSSPNITNYFGVPPSPNNFIKPGNRPLSSMCPSVVVEIDNTTNTQSVKMVAGASGGTKITTSTALTIMNSLFFGFDVGTSVEMKRLHDQLMPNVTEFENGFDQAVIEGLRKKGHDTEVKQSAGSVVQAIEVLPDGTIDAASDTRKGGYPAGY